MRIRITEKEWGAIVAMLGNEATAEDKEQFQIWLSNNPNHNAYYKELKKDWTLLETFKSYKKYNTKGAWKEIEKKAGDELKQLNAFSLYNKRSKVYEILKIAASFLAAFGLSWFVWRSLPEKKALPEMSVFQVVVPKGEKSQFILSDGTKVWLNSDSRLSYTNNFGETDRHITLTGEAYFEVAKDKSKPFIIETPGFDVKVTGTSFNLNTYKEEEINSLTLHTGEVFINRKGKEFKVLPGEKFLLNQETQVLKIVNANLEESALWKEGYIVINDMNLEEIKKLLERKYNIHIVITKENYKTIKYTGTFKPYETLRDVLELIRSASPFKFNYQINTEKNVVTIE